MRPSSPITDILDLLDELERGVQQDPPLAAEWAQAQAARPESATHDDPDRFREWFLLERPAVNLGTSPLQAWAPQDIQEGSSWARLLDNFLGIFRIAGVRRVEGAEYYDLVDLWSGRTVEVPQASLLGADPNQTDDQLWVGRLVLGHDDAHRPLPGFQGLTAPGLVAAIEKDLALARHQNPRARLSQRECDALFALNVVPSAGGGAEEILEPIEDLLAELEELLANAPGWDTDRIQDSLEATGLAATLDQLAFDTQADLEALRRLLPAMARASGVGHEEPQEGLVDASRSSQIRETIIERGDLHNPAQALEAYDRARAEGQPVADAFRELEQALGLEPGTSDEVLPEAGGAAHEAVGPGESASLEAWLEAYAWDREGIELNELLRSFAISAQAAAGKGLDAVDLRHEHILPFFMASESEAELHERRHAIHDFLVWAAQEQDAPLGEALDDWAAPEDERLPALVRANVTWRTQGRTWNHRAPLTGVDPATVLAEGGDQAEVRGFPEELAARLRTGDWILGRWVDGALVAAAVMPREALPAAPEPDALTAGDDGAEA